MIRTILHGLRVNYNAMNIITNRRRWQSNKTGQNNAENSVCLKLDKYFGIVFSFSEWIYLKTQKKYTLKINSEDVRFVRPNPEILFKSTDLVACHTNQEEIGSHQAFWGHYFFWFLLKMSSQRWVAQHCLNILYFGGISPQPSAQPSASCWFAGGSCDVTASVIAGSEQDQSCPQNPRHCSSFIPKRAEPQQRP